MINRYKAQVFAQRIAAQVAAGALLKIERVELLGTHAIVSGAAPIPGYSVHDRVSSPISVLLFGRVRDAVPGHRPFPPSRLGQQPRKLFAHSGSLLHWSTASGVSSAATIVIDQGPTLVSPSLPKPTHFPAKRRGPGWSSSSIWIAPV